MASGVTTQWEDIHVANGNLKPKAYEPTAEDIFEADQEDAEKFNPTTYMGDKQLKEMVEDDPTFEEEEDEFIREYKAKRLQEMKFEATKPKYGTVYEIIKQDWEIEVTRAPPGVFVLIHLYQDQ